MKTHVITVAKRFPTTHPKSGVLTKFDESITNRTKIHTIRKNVPFWASRIQDVQDGKAVLSIREWKAKPYSSKQNHLFQRTASDGVGFELAYKTPEGIVVNGKYYTKKVARNDGLSMNDFVDWFEEVDFYEPLIIIHFTEFRYG